MIKSGIRESLAERILQLAIDSRSQLGGVDLRYLSMFEDKFLPLYICCRSGWWLVEHGHKTYQFTIARIKSGEGRSNSLRASMDKHG